MNQNPKTASGEEVPENLIYTCRKQYKLPEEAIIYCNFNQLYKIDSPALEMWVDILKKVPNAVLWLLFFPAEGEANIIANAEKLGLEKAKERILFSAEASKEEHVRRGLLADVFLDTPLCNGHTTGMDALWSGIPIVTLPRDYFPSRVAASLLHALGCPKLVANTAKDYVKLAVRLGSDRKYLRFIRAKVWRLRMTSPLFNVRRFAHDLEEGYFRIWEEYVKSNSQSVITRHECTSSDSPMDISIESAALTPIVFSTDVPSNSPTISASVESTDVRSYSESTTRTAESQPSQARTNEMHQKRGKSIIEPEPKRRKKLIPKRKSTQSVSPVEQTAAPLFGWSLKNFVDVVTSVVARVPALFSFRKARESNDAGHKSGSQQKREKLMFIRDKRKRRKRRKGKRRNQKIKRNKRKFKR